MSTVTLPEIEQNNDEESETMQNIFQLMREKFKQISIK